MQHYSLERRVIDGVPQSASFDVKLNGGIIGRFTGGVFYPDAEYYPTVPLMEYLIRKYKELNSLDQSKPLTCWTGD